MAPATIAACAARMAGRGGAAGGAAAVPAAGRGLGGTGVADQLAEHQGDPGGRPDGVPRGLVARHRRAVDQRVLVRVRAGPVPDRVADRPPAAARPGRAVRRGGCLGGFPERVVGVDDQRGEQVVPAREVAVEGRGDQPELAGHRPQGQLRGAGLGQLTAGRLLDLPGQLGPGALPRGLAGVRRGGVHGGSLPRMRSPIKYESTALDMEHSAAACWRQKQRALLSPEPRRASRRYRAALPTGECDDHDRAPPGQLAPAGTSCPAAGRTSCSTGSSRS